MNEKCWLFCWMATSAPAIVTQPTCFLYSQCVAYDCMKNWLLNLYINRINTIRMGVETDHILLQLLRTSDPQGFKVLFQKYYKTLCIQAYLLLQDEGEA